jgi:hypothetical protein
MNEETIIGIKLKKEKDEYFIWEMNCKKITYFKTLQFPVTIQLKKMLSKSNIFRTKLHK